MGLLAPMGLWLCADREREAAAGRISMDPKPAPEPYPADEPYSYLAVSEAL